MEQVFNCQYCKQIDFYYSREVKVLGARVESFFPSHISSYVQPKTILKLFTVSCLSFEMNYIMVIEMNKAVAMKGLTLGLLHLHFEF